MLPILATVLVFLLLLMPEQSAGRLGDDRLSAHLPGSLGARALKDVAARFGWRVVLRDSTPAPVQASGITIHAVLAPPLPPTAAQAHRYLEAVRGGDALLIVLGDRNPLSDSLGLRRARLGGILMIPEADSAGCDERPRDFTPPLWPDARVHLYALRWVRGVMPGTVVFAQVLAERARAAPLVQQAAAGFPFGKGRVVVVSDPDLLRNDVLRRCDWGADVVAMQMLEWLRAGSERPRTTLEFDEFHQGFGPRPSSGSVTWRFLLGHPVGRTILQCVLAALVLVLALAPRPILPRLRPRQERRDPLEQADALAHAYQQVKATRTATQRLVRGMRSRVELAGRRTHAESDTAFLDAVAATNPSMASDVSVVQRALRSPISEDRLSDVGAALRRIEDALTTTTLSGA